MFEFISFSLPFIFNQLVLLNYPHFTNYDGHTNSKLILKEKVIFSDIAFNNLDMINCYESCVCAVLNFNESNNILQWNLMIIDPNYVWNDLFNLSLPVLINITIFRWWQQLTEKTLNLKIFATLFSIDFSSNFSPGLKKRKRSYHPNSMTIWTMV